MLLPQTKPVPLQDSVLRIRKNHPPQENKRHVIHVSRNKTARNTCEQKIHTQTSHMNPYANTEVEETKSS